MSRFNQQRYTQDALLDVSTALPMEDPERLLVAHDVAGFYPTTHRELTVVTDLKDMLSTEAGGAILLGTIYGHQKKAATDDPAAAVRAVTREMSAYALKARADLTALLSLEEELDGKGTDKRRLMGKMDLPTGPMSGVGQFVREYDLNLLADPLVSEDLPFDPLKGHTRADDNRADAFDRYTAAAPSPEVRQRIESVLETTSLGRARARLEPAIEGQQSRGRFWSNRLMEAQYNRDARPIAAKALDSLGYAPPNA